MATASESRWIGIDLGTTNSVVAVVNKGKVQVLFSSYDSSLLKSCVYYEKNSDRCLVGNADARFTQPQNIIYDAKRLIGVRFDDPQGRVQRFRQRYGSSSSVANCGGWAGFEVQHAGKRVMQLPQEVGAKILAKLRAVAEEQMDGRMVRAPIVGAQGRPKCAKAVITVPATFSQEQRLATIEAGRMVFDEVHLITEAVAAAYAACQTHGWLRHEGSKLLVYDFGGGTFDTCIVYIEGGEFHAKHLDGDRELGGGDLDRALRDYCAAEILRKYGKDCSAKASLERSEILLERCEQLKVRLSHCEADSISLEFLGIYERLHVTRECLEKLCMPLLMRSIAIVQRMMKEAKLGIKDIDQVLLVGGTSNMPLVENLFCFYAGFEPEKLNHSVKAGHANAEGAAIVGDQLGRAEKDHDTSALKLVEYTSLSLGISVMDNVFSVIIPCDHRIPCKLSENYYTSFNDQQAMRFAVYEGERKLASENFHLGTFSLHGLPPAAARDCQVKLSFEIDRDGILLAVATQGDNIASLKMRNLEISDSRNVEEAIKLAAVNFEADSKEAERQRQKYELKNAIERAKYKCTNRQVIELCEQYAAWLASNDGATQNVLKERLDAFRRELPRIS